MLKAIYVRWKLAQSLLFCGLMRFVTPLIMPGGLLLLASALFFEWVAPPQTLSAISHMYPYAVLGAGLFFGWRFNRSQLVFAILVLVFAERGLQYYAAVDTTTGIGRIVFNAVALLLPINLAALSQMSERGIVTIRGLFRLSLILLQPIAVVLICRPEYADLASLLEQRFLGLHPVLGLTIAQPALLAFGGAFIVMTIRFIRQPHAVTSGFIWALVAVFIGLNTKPIGAVSTIYHATAGLILIASFIEISYILAYRDDLTGLPTRRALNDILLKLGSQYTVAMVDIDHFKKFNDRYGHDAGDQLLRMVASNLARVPGGGKAFRYGGEEFTVVFPGKSLQEALPHLEALRKTVETSRFTLRSHSRPTRKPKKPRPNESARRDVSVTVSIGVAHPTEGNVDAEEVLAAADEALYRAKRSGRNRINI